MMSYLGATELRLLEERVDDDMGASFIPISGNHKLLLSLFGGTISPQDLILPLTDERLFLATTSGSVSFDSTVAAYSCTAILWHSDGLQNGYCVFNDWRHTKLDVEKKWRNCNMNNKTSAATGAGKVWNVWKQQLVSHWFSSKWRQQEIKVISDILSELRQDWIFILPCGGGGNSRDTFLLKCEIWLLFVFSFLGLM